MMPARAVLIVMVVFLCFPFISISPPGNLPWEELSLFQSTAWAAGELNGDYLKEPFAETPEEVKELHEPLNRAMFKLNDKLYFWVLKPLSTVYSAFIPEGVRICIRNAHTNIKFPIRFVNNALQGKLQGAGIELARFVVNSTLGVGGMFEIANKEFKLKPHNEDFGQTLGVWGIKPGPYIVLPFFGPSSVRDAIGLVGDYFLDPILYLSPEIAISAAIKAGTTTNHVSLRIGEYEDFKKAALDPHVSMRDAYLQHRSKEVKK